jgi:NitT/TauT family transport system permease protein
MSALERNLMTRAETAARRERRSHLAAPIITIVLVAITWQAAVLALGVPRYILPKPTEILNAFVVQADVLAANSVVTMSAIVVGWVLSIVLGILVGLALFTWPLVERSVYPLVVGAQAIPKVAIAPLFAIWFGYGLATRSLIAFLIAVFPVLISMMVGLKSIEEEKIWLARSMGLGTRATFLRIRLPQALPTLFGGIKVALTLSAVGAIVGEFVGGASGLGYLIQRANHDFNTPLLFASLGLIAFYTVALFVLLELVEGIVIPWRIKRGSRLQQ